MSTNTIDKCSCARLRPNKKDKVVIIVLQHDCVFIIIRVSGIPDECPDAALCPTSYYPLCSYKLILFLSLSPQLSLKLGRNTIAVLIDTKLITSEERREEDGYT